MISGIQSSFVLFVDTLLPILPTGDVSLSAAGAICGQSTVIHVSRGMKMNMSPRR
jgi:hypothetical protein